MVVADLRIAISDLARDAGRATLPFYDGVLASNVREKEDRSPVTLADEAAHEILVSGLREIDSDTPIISEEAEAASADDRRSWRRFWLVDPLDGTKEFLKRRAEFTVNVALIEDGEPVLGVVLAPALDLLYWAVKGEGAWREEKGKPAERIYSTPAAPGTPLTVVESLSHPSPELEEYLKTISVARRVKAGRSRSGCRKRVSG
jgi:3'(2'), 5'-bisphosphate nucleotidase